MSAEDLKKTRNLNGSKLEPAIRSFNTGQRIPCFDSCHLIETCAIDHPTLASTRLQRTDRTKFS